MKNLESGLQMPEAKKPDTNKDVEVLEPGQTIEQTELDKQVAESAGTEKIEQDLKTAREGIKGVDEGAKKEREAYLLAVKSKLQEMRTMVLEKQAKNATKPRLFRSKDEVYNKALTALAKQEGMVNSGRSVDLKTVKDAPSLRSLVNDVDVSDFPENPNKSYSASNSAGFNVMGK